MAQNSSVYLVPLIGAFVLFIVKCYAYENARVRGSLAFLFAMLCVLLLISYMGMIVLGVMPSYTAFAYGVIGVGMLGLAVTLLRT